MFARFFAYELFYTNLNFSFYRIVLIFDFHFLCKKYSFSRSGFSVYKIEFHLNSCRKSPRVKRAIFIDDFFR